MERRNGNENQRESSSLSSKKKPKEPCEICGSVGIAALRMICFKCRHTHEHTYCTRVFLSSVPRAWLCEACRISYRVLHISHVADDLIDSEATFTDGSLDPKNTNNSRADDHGAAKLRTNDMEDVVDACEASTRGSNCEISANVNTVMHLPSQRHTSSLAKETLLSQNKEQQQHQPTQGFPKKRRTIRVLGKHLSQSHDRTLISPLDQSASPK